MVKKLQHCPETGIIDKFLKLSALRFLPCVKKKEKEEEGEEEDDEVVITGMTETAQPSRYIPKVVPGVEKSCADGSSKNLKDREEGVQKVHQSLKVDKIQNVFYCG